VDTEGVVPILEPRLGGWNSAARSPHSGLSLKWQLLPLSPDFVTVITSVAITLIRDIESGN
jgi:hypothetical protein